MCWRTSLPDFTFITTGHERLLAGDGTRGGGPDAVIEIRSPDDETYDKLPFFAGLGVREVIVIDRDTKQPEILRLAGERYATVQGDREGWVQSDLMHVRFRRTAGARLAIEDLGDLTTRTEI